ncbi:putative DCC family thiol-disulfide oxidoreductase YuxK [Salsuginibacillus halophilus]|uniref:Putative DCC family thiol-disulfide oxidoreductase YuxK n=1 Tax=Salsuginibacillus halophilus TaxID=517424 RepID=A0A2P8HE56_9BACI|nr:DUF393 domain-containing protein [Salsuginibacillus halophilus]PSL44494.1 putative DCC family thiol-disulfide oxidoreductase YuxK [Salsuginibacillus halophilus]
MKLYVFYDGACPLCVNAKAALNRLDVTDCLVWHSIRDPRVYEVFHFLNQIDAEGAIHALEDDEYVYRGFAAVRRMLKVMPLTKPAGWLFALPGMERPGDVVYRWIAARRPVKTDEAICHDGLCQVSAKKERIR